MYIAGYNMPGFMPDNEPVEFETLQDAFECMLSEAEQYLDELTEDCRYNQEQIETYKQYIAECKQAGPQECNLYLDAYVF
jgi:hypothetical protein